MKKTLLLFILSLLFIPSTVMARTKEEAEEYFKEIPIIENEDGSCSFELETIPLDILVSNTCNYSKKELLEKMYGWEELTDEELEIRIKDYLDSCAYSLTYYSIEKKGRELFDDSSMLLRSEFLDNYSKIDLAIDYDNEFGSGAGEVKKTCNIKYAEYDEKVLKDALKVTKKIKNDYVMYGFDTFNSFYHYGMIFDNDFYNPNLSLYRFPELKNILTDNPEFDYNVVTMGGGGTPTYVGLGGGIEIYKDGILYANKEVNFGYNTVLPVDKDLSGTVFEKAENRLNEFFKGKAEIKLDVENANILDDEYADIDLNKTLGTKDVKYKAYFTMGLLNDVEVQILIVEVDSKLLDKFEVRAKHKNTGVHVHTNSYEVPIDATLDVTDKKDKVKDVFSGKYQLIDAFDINVVKTATGGFVKTIEDGILVYIPINNRKVGEKLKVYHVTDNNKRGEEFTGEVVEYEGRHYVKFKTTHFSTYAVVDTINPDTSDGIISTIICFICGVLGLIVLMRFRPNKRED